MEQRNDQASAIGTVLLRSCVSLIQVPLMILRRRCGRSGEHADENLYGRLRRDYFSVVSDIGCRV